MPYLRLEAAAGLVKSGDVLCDVGSDHAYLPLMLIKNGVIERAVACDVNAGPLERGRQHAAKQGVSSIEFVLSDGLGSVETPFDVAAICGMGGELIIRIIREGGEKGKKRLILQPMTGIEKVRAFLWQSGFAITDEVFPVEDGKARNFRAPSPIFRMPTHISEKSVPAATDLPRGQKKYARRQKNGCAAHAMRKAKTTFLH